MNKPVVALAAATLLYLGVADQGSNQSSTFTAEKEKEHLIAEVNSLSRMLFELAAERFFAGSERNETSILTFHSGKAVQKYSDGQYTVISLPVVEQGDRTGVCRYTEQYNSFIVDAADQKVLAGKYKEAAHLYRLLLHFNHCDGLFNERLKARLRLAQGLEREEDVESNRRKLKHLMETDQKPFPRTDLSQIHKIQPLIVTDLLQIRLK